MGVFIGIVSMQHVCTADFTKHVKLEFDTYVGVQHQKLAGFTRSISWYVSLVKSGTYVYVSVVL
jgi:hypothetical protein